jgi:hypothetical protein
MNEGCTQAAPATRFIGRSGDLGLSGHRMQHDSAQEVKPSMSRAPLLPQIARWYGFARGLMLALLSLAILVAPETGVPGAATEPARSLALVFGSRSILLGCVLVVMSLRRLRLSLAWVLWLDAALQIFDTLLALATGKGALALLPAALGIADVIAGLILVRAGRTSNSSVAD